MTIASVFATWMLIVMGVGLALGLSLLAFAWRGRRIDDHPWCRGCRFDLVGSWPGAKACPECGADLARRPRAVGQGQRRKRPVLLALAILLVGAPLGGSGFRLWSMRGQINWNAYKPTWWLVNETRSGQTSRVDGAARELGRRLAADAKAIDEKTRVALIDRALDVQGDLGTPWVAGWGDLVEAAWRADLLDEGHRQRYARQSLPSVVSTCQSIPAGRPVTLGVRLNGIRVGHGPGAIIGAAPTGIHLEGKPLAMNRFDGAGSVTGNATMTMAVGLAAAPAAPGEYVLETLWQFYLSFESDPDGLTATWRQDLSIPLIVLPPASGTIATTDDPAVGTALRQAMTVSAVGVLNSVEGPALVIRVGSRNPPALAHFLVEVHDAAGRSAFPAFELQIDGPKNGAAEGSMWMRVPVGDWRSDTVTFAFGPDLHGLMQASPVTRDGRPGTAWVGRFEIADVPVRWYESADEPDFPPAMRDPLADFMRDEATAEESNMPGGGDDEH